jgi:hypothetical protein
MTSIYAIAEQILPTPITIMEDSDIIFCPFGNMSLRTIWER